MWYKLQRSNVAHEDYRRQIRVLFNGDFVAKQIKLLSVKRLAILGNHYHHYREMFYVAGGRAIYFLEHARTEERVTLELKAGDVLIIEPEVAHTAKMWRKTRMIEATEEPYISPEENDVPYPLDWADYVKKKKPGRKPLKLESK